jgi:hypothetical protein
MVYLNAAVLHRLSSLAARAALIGGLGLAHVVRADFYVSAAGADTNPGTKLRPFATLETARDAVRQLKSVGRVPRRGVTVWLRGGDYHRARPLELQAQDSGAPGAPITWRGYPGESPRLLGGLTLSAFDPVQDAAVRARLDEPARTQVRQCDLRALGLHNYGTMKSRGFGRATVPAHAELFFGGRPMTLARWPNEGQFTTIAGFPDSGGQDDGHGGKLGGLEAGFTYAGDRPRRWQRPEDLWVHGYWAWDWANSYERVAALDLDRHLVRTAPPHGLYGFRPGQRFYFVNVLEELDAPGEWFLDRAAGLLYFWPPAGLASQAGTRASSAGASDSPEVLLSLLDQPLLRLTGVSHVTWRGVVLEATRSSAVEMREGASNRIAGCVIRNLGNYGVTITGGHGHGVVSCDLFDTGDGGVSLSGGDRRTLAPGGHYVENCHFARQGRWSKCYVPAVLLDGVGHRVSRNLVHDHPHCAMLFTGNDHLLELNEIHHIALETGDVGAIYTGRDYTYRGNRIRHNFIHHTGGVGMGSMGVYLDDCVSGVEVYGNIFDHVQRAAFLGGGRDHRVCNNIFVDCNHAVELDGRGLDASPVWRGMVNDTMRQRLAEVPAALYRERYPALTNLDRFYGAPGAAPVVGDAFKGVPPEDNVVTHNVCVGKWLNVYWHARTNLLTLATNLVETDPMFAGRPGEPARPADYALKPASPAWALGFQRIPFDQIGLRSDDLRRALPRGKGKGVSPGY